MHLRLDTYFATKRAEERMRELGITYQHATPQTSGDQWWFWNCKNVPDSLPADLTPLGLSPMQCIGRGLSREMAEEIRDYGSN